MNHPQQIAVTLVWACAAAAAPARDAAPPPACLQVLEALQARESALIGALPVVPDATSSADFQRRPDAQLLALRRSAALACLGADAGSRPALASRAEQAPIAVAPITGLQAPPVLRLRLDALTPTTQPLPPTPTLVTNCDPTGCWTNTGARLSRVGDQLWGPRGLCTVQGVSLHCP